MTGGFFGLLAAALINAVRDVSECKMSLTAFFVESSRNESGSNDIVFGENVRVL